MLSSGSINSSNIAVQGTLNSAPNITFGSILRCRLPGTLRVGEGETRSDSLTSHGRPERAFTASARRRGSDHRDATDQMEHIRFSAARAVLADRRLSSSRIHPACWFAASSDPERDCQHRHARHNAFSIPGPASFVSPSRRAAMISDAVITMPRLSGLFRRPCRGLMHRAVTANGYRSSRAYLVRVGHQHSLYRIVSAPARTSSLELVGTDVTDLARPTARLIQY